LPKPCPRCEDDSLAGLMVLTPGVQNGARLDCALCGRKAVHWPSKAELQLAPGEKATLARRGFSVSVESRVFFRDGGRCFVCRELPDPPNNPLEVGHIVSLHDAGELGWTQEQTDDESNLLALCKRHNLGLSSTSLDPEKVWAERARRELDLRYGGQA
jgi:hypothetical protein